MLDFDITNNFVAMLKQFLISLQRFLHYSGNRTPSSTGSVRSSYALAISRPSNI
jgi:hypothetical protein